MVVRNWPKDFFFQGHGYIERSFYGKIGSLGSLEIKRVHAGRTTKVRPLELPKGIYLQRTRGATG